MIPSAITRDNNQPARSIDRPARLAVASPRKPHAIVMKGSRCEWEAFLYPQARCRPRSKRRRGGVVTLITSSAKTTTNVWTLSYPCYRYLAQVASNSLFRVSFFLSLLQVLTSSRKDWTVFSNGKERYVIEEEAYDQLGAQRRKTVKGLNWGRTSEGVVEGNLV